MLETQWSRQTDWKTSHRKRLTPLWPLWASWFMDTAVSSHAASGNQRDQPGTRQGHRQSREPGSLHSYKAADPPGLILFFPHIFLFYAPTRLFSRLLPMWSKDPSEDDRGGLGLLAWGSLQVLAEVQLFYSDYRAAGSLGLHWPLEGRAFLSTAMKSLLFVSLERQT